MANQEESKKIKVIFMGTPEFSLAGMNSLINSKNYEIISVFTQADKKIGREQLITPPPVKRLALENNIPVFQPEKIKDERENIKNLKPDLIVVIAYGKIIPQSILDISVHGCINVHASLLPKYRGAACLNAPILNGDKETGVTIMKMEAGLDTGPILRQAVMNLNGTESLEIVHDTLSNLGAEILIPTLDDFIDGKIEPKIQEDANASYIKTLSKEDGKINWDASAVEIERQVRAYNPWPGTYTYDGNKSIKILEVENNVLRNNTHKIGESYIDNSRLVIQCGQDSLVILRLQAAGKKPMTSVDFLRGNKINGLLK